MKIITQALLGLIALLGTVLTSPATATAHTAPPVASAAQVAKSQDYNCGALPSAASVCVRLVPSQFDYVNTIRISCVPNTKFRNTNPITDGTITVQSYQAGATSPSATRSRPGNIANAACVRDVIFNEEMPGACYRVVWTANAHRSGGATQSFGYQAYLGPYAETPTSGGAGTCSWF